MRREDFLSESQLINIEGITQLEKYYFAAIISIINSGKTHSWNLKLFSYKSLINEKEKNVNFTVEKPDRYHLT